MKLLLTSVLTVSVMLVGLAFACQTHAETIISDNFSWVTDAASIVGASPFGPGNVNLPGGSYTTQNNGQFFRGTASTGNQPPGICGQSKITGTQASALLPFWSNGDYTKPTQFTLSADLRLNNVNGSSSAATNPRGLGLGFVDNGQRYFGLGGFTGFLLDSTGQLTLVQVNDADPRVATTSISVTWSGPTFDTTAFYRLTYTVNTATGRVSNVSLSESTADYTTAFANAMIFTNAATTYLAMVNDAQSGNKYGYFDNLLVTAVPEPSTLALLAAGLIGLFAYVWHRRK